MKKTTKNARQFPETLFLLSPIIACLVFLQSCSLTPDYQKPDVATSSQWANGDEQAAQPAESWRTRWWEDFHSPQLTMLVEKGLKEGMDLRIALARLEQARSQAEIAGSSLYPSLNIGASAPRSSTNYSSSNRRTGSLQGSFTLDLWGGQRAALDAAEKEAEASIHDVATARNALIAGIVTNYVQTLALDERIALAQQIAGDAQNLLILIEKQERLGTVASLDVQQQRNTVQTFQAAIPVLQQQRAATLAQLAVLVGSTPEALRLAPERLLDLRLPDAQSVSPLQVVNNRPEIQAAEARLQAANFNIGAARAAFLPTVSITAQTGAISNATPMLMWNVVGNLLQPVFSGGLLNGQLALERAKAEELLASYQQILLQTLQQTETQLAAVQRTREAEAFHKAAVESASESLRLSRYRYERGASDLLTVIVSQRTLSQAQDTLVQTRQQRLQALASLYQATGAGGGSNDAVSPPQNEKPSTEGL